MIRRDKFSLLPFVLLLFALSFLLRIRGIHRDVLGDESLYFYLSKTLGIASAPMKSMHPLWTHVAVRPFMYLFNFAWARLGFTTFRFVNILVGSAVPCLIFALSVRMRASPYVAACVALLASLHPQFILFSVVGFPDMLATALLLCGLLAYQSNSTRWATVFLCLTVLTKEAFAMFLIPLLVDGSVALLRTRKKLVIAPLVGLVAVALTNSFEIFILRGPPQGWSNNKIGAEFYGEFFWSWWFFPFGLLLLLGKQYRLLLLGLGAPAFFFVWGNVMKKGIETWYIIGPFSVALVLVAVAVQVAVDSLKTPPWSTHTGETRSAFHWLSVSKSSCAAAGLLVLILAPCNTGWRRIDIEQSIAALREPWLKAGSGRVAQAAAVLGQMQPENLLVMDVFWGFAYYPFGVLAHGHVDSMCTVENDNCRPSEARLTAALAKRSHVVWANIDTQWAKMFQGRLKSCLVYHNAEYNIYKLNDDCRNGR